MEEVNEVVRCRHAAYQTPTPVLFDIVREATGQAVERHDKIVRGYDNEVYRVTTRTGETFIVRIRRHGKTSFAAEAWALEQCRRVGAPVPEVLLVSTRVLDDHGNAPPREVMVQRQVPGRTLSDIEHMLSPRERERVWAQAGAALRAIHGVQTGGFYKRLADGTWDFPTWDRLMAASLRDRTAEAPLLLRAGFTDDDIGDILAMMEACRRDFPCPQPVLCRGDFLPAHLIVDDALTLRGIIDFGEFHGGPPIGDLAVLSMERPDIPLAWLRSGYGDVPWWDEAFPTRLLLHKTGLQTGYLAYYLQQNNTAEAEPVARGLRATLDTWRRTRC